MSLNRKLSTDDPKVRPILRKDDPKVRPLIYQVIDEAKKKFFKGGELPIGEDFYNVIDIHGDPEEKLYGFVYWLRESFGENSDRTYLGKIVDSEGNLKKIKSKKTNVNEEISLRNILDNNLNLFTYLRTNY